MPVHVFLRKDFEVIAGEVDTIPDFLEYLSIRQRLMSQEILSPFTNELDFLAIFKTRRDWIDKCLQGEVNLLAITDGVWTSHLKNHHQEREQRKSRLQPSYLVDEIIEEFHKGVTLQWGRKPTPSPGPPAIERAVYGKTMSRGGNNVLYLEVISELAALRRVERLSVARLLNQKMDRATVQEFSYGLVLSPAHGGIVVMASNYSRRRRAERLQQLCALAYVHRRLRRVVGIATESRNAPARSYDCVILEGMTFENEEELREMARQVFVVETPVKLSEWKG